MPVSVTFYNHTPKRIVAGEFPITDTYVVNLYSALPANATATTKAAAESGATQIATGNGYTQNTKTLAGLAATVVTTNDGKLTFNPVEWTAAGGSIAAAYALIYDDTQTDDPPYARIDFGGTVTAADGTIFRISPHSDGFIVLSNAA